MARPIKTRFCEHCNEPISRGVTSCENCGTPLRKHHKRYYFAIAVFLILLTAIVVGSVSKYVSSARYESPADSGANPAADSGNSSNP